MGLVDDQQFAQTFFPYCPDPALGNGIGIRGSKRRMNDADTFRLEGGIESSCEPGVVVVDQEVNGWRSIFQCPDHLSGVLSNPSCIRMRRATREVDTPRAEFDKEQHVDRLQEQGVEGEEIAGKDLGLVVLYELY